MGYLDCLHYALTNGCPRLEHMATAAVHAGRVEVLQYLSAHNYAVDPKLTIISLALKKLECFKLALQLSDLTSPILSRFAAASGQFDVLAYMRESGVYLYWDAQACANAATNGHLNCLTLLHEAGAWWDETTCRGAAGNGHLDCLRCAYEHGCSWDEQTCHSAAGRGQLECLKYAHENGCPWSELTSQAAAENGRLACLYLLESGCPFDAVAYAAAQARRRTDCAQYLLQHDCVTGVTFVKNGRAVGLEEIGVWRNYDSFYEL